jgi:hypothetical protein
MSPSETYWTVLVLMTAWELARPAYLIVLGSVLLARAFRRK